MTSARPDAAAATRETSFHALLTGLEGYSSQVASYEFFPPRRARLEDGYDGPFAGALATLGAVPYRHQARGFEALGGGADLVVATPTASGKSLLFQVPVVSSMLDGRTSLLLFPTKALAHDQLERLRAVARDLGGGEAGSADGVITYDGDTPAEKRGELRDAAGAVLTNPDMLHYGILPYHDRWASFLGRLDYLVLDELHAYRGVLGTHVANVVRRLLRLAERYGARPQVICASATIGNPAEHAARLTGRDFAVIAEDDAASAAREFILWRPAQLDGGERRRSANSEAAFLAAEFARRGLRSIFFCNSRKSAELIRRYASGQVAPELALQIQSYRAGYTAEDRRLLEAGFKNGDITVLTATSALELGMDIGGVDAVVMVGYPGSKMALWQRAGRAGRAGRRALALLIPAADPLDEYYLTHPELLVDGPVENAVADPFNTVVHPLHMACAAAEAPLSQDEPLVAPWLDLDTVPRLYRTPAGYAHRGRYPHRRISLRGSGGQLVRLKDGNGKTIGVTDRGSALRDLHPGAVYLHQGDTHLVARLDLERGVAHLLPHIEDYYTQPRSQTEIEIIAQTPAVLPRGVHVGEVLVRHDVTSYVRKRYFSEAVLEERPLDLPEITYTTQAVWFCPQEVVAGGESAGPPDPTEVSLPHGEAAGPAPLPSSADLPAALHALEHTMIQLLPAFVLCERADVGGVSYPLYPPTGSSAVFVYDGYPGGVGYARAGAEVFERWLRAAFELLGRCPCVDGCPRCVLSPKCGNGNQVLDKASARSLAGAMLTRLSSGPRPAAAA